ncbi:hypothetical protein QQ045_020707 [Rhodiola kirilowii]
MVEKSMEDALTQGETRLTIGIVSSPKPKGTRELDDVQESAEVTEGVRSSEESHEVVTEKILEDVQEELEELETGEKDIEKKDRESDLVVSGKGSDKDELKIEEQDDVPADGKTSQSEERLRSQKMFQLM